MIFEDEVLSELLGATPQRSTSRLHMDSVRRRRSSLGCLERNSFDERILQASLDNSCKIWEMSTLLSLNSYGERNSSFCMNAPHTLRLAEPVSYTVAVAGFTGTLPKAEAGALALLQKHNVATQNVVVFVSSAVDVTLCKQRFAGTVWEGVNLIVATGERDCERWASLTSCFPDGEAVVIIDPELSEILWKRLPGNAGRALTPLPAGSFEPLIFDSVYRMKQTGADVCSMHQTARGMQVDGISTSVGSVAGKLLFTLNSQRGRLASLQSGVLSASVQHQDAILWYRM
jgi:hypothetical protein